MKHLLEFLKKMSPVNNDIRSVTSKNHSAHFAASSIKHSIFVKSSKLSK